MALSVLFVVVILFYSTSARPAREVRASQRPECPDIPLSNADKETLKRNCQKIAGRCKVQPKEAIEKKKAIRQELIDDGEKPEVVDRALKKTFEAKLALYKSEGLSEILPADDGMWADDELLSEQEAQSIIDCLSSSNNRADGNREKRGVVLSYNLFPEQKWPMPVPYFIEPGTYTKWQINQIHQALAGIESRTCVRFTELKTKPTSGNFIIYNNEGDKACGTSPVGMQPDGNQIFLSSKNAACQEDFYGVVQHETLHSLGFEHEHMRRDRDKYIKVIWENIQPQRAYNYAVADSHKYTPYGVPYDVKSIMHYQANPIGPSVDDNKPAMVSLHGAIHGSGTTRLSDGDVEVLKRTYCENPNCADVDVSCGWRASEGKCKTNASIRKNCPQSCNLCS